MGDNLWGRTIKNLFHKRRAEDDPTVVFWSRLLGYRPTDVSLFETATTHRSRSNNPKEGTSSESNERLEYLGDAVISLVVADRLYRLYTGKNEGFLTRARAKVVCREHLNDVAHEIGVAEHVMKGKGVRDNADNIFGNAMEAVVGAVYLDQGFEKAALFVEEKIVGDDFRLKKLVEREVDFKSRLLEYADAHHLSVVFDIIDDHYDSASDSHSYVCRVVVDGKPIAQAAGKNKRSAQQAAAKKTLGVVKTAQKKQKK